MTFSKGKGKLNHIIEDIKNCNERMSRNRKKLVGRVNDERKITDTLPYFLTLEVCI